jgi:hypothetical protein
MAAYIADKQSIAAEDLDRLLAIEAGGVGTWRWDAASDTFGLPGRSRVLVGVETTAPDFSAFLAHVHPDDRERVDRGWRESLQSGQAHDIGFRTLGDDNQGHWLRMRGRPILEKRRPVECVAFLSMSLRLPPRSRPTAGLPPSLRLQMTPLLARRWTASSRTGTMAPN